MAFTVGEMQQLESLLDRKLDEKLGVRFAQQDAKFEARFAKIDARFEEIDARFDQIDARFEQIDRKFEEIDTRFEQIDKRFDEIDARFIDIESYLTTLIRQEIATVNSRIDRLIRQWDENLYAVVTDAERLTKRVTKLEKQCES